MAMITFETSSVFIESKPGIVGTTRNTCVAIAALPTILSHFAPVGHVIYFIQSYVWHLC